MKSPRQERAHKKTPRLLAAIRGVTGISTFESAQHASADIIPPWGFYGVAPMQNPSCRAPRDVIVGWSSGAARRNLHFLQSIDERRLTGIGWALTLTVRDCPESPELWHRLVRDYFQQVGRALGTFGLKLDRYHYVTEWQKRGVPHLHGAVYISGEFLNAPGFLKRTWLQYAGRYGASSLGQYVLPVAGAVGWFQYVSKHAARGIKHYQRSSKAIPDAWQSGTGRMWGKGGTGL